MIFNPNWEHNEFMGRMIYMLEKAEVTGYDHGYADGSQEGYAEGYMEGLEKGKDEGYNRQRFGYEPNN